MVRALQSILRSVPAASAVWTGRLRAARVCILLLAAVLLSTVDLTATLYLARTTGMYEDNPIAAALMRTTGSPAAVAAFKILTFGSGVTILFRLRQRWQAEVGAWLSVLALMGAVVMTGMYVSILRDTDPEGIRWIGVKDASWVSLR